MVKFENFAFLKRIKESGVLPKYWMSVFILAGMTMFGLTLAAYVMQYLELGDVFDGDEKISSKVLEKRISSLSLAVIIIHSAVGALVAFDTWGFSGKSIFLQSLIIGGGSFNTFIQTILTAVSFNYPTHYFFAYALSALGLACLSNAMMLALLFAMFHTGVSKSGKEITGSTNSNIGKLAF